MSVCRLLVIQSDMLPFISPRCFQISLTFIKTMLVASFYYTKMPSSHASFPSQWTSKSSHCLTKISACYWSDVLPFILPRCLQAATSMHQDACYFVRHASFHFQCRLAAFFIPSRYLLATSFYFVKTFTLIITVESFL